MVDVKTYRSHRGLPSLAGLATIEDAARPGLSVEACVARLKRYHYAFLRLHEILTARITAEPIYELKTAFSHHAYLCAEHVAVPSRTRIGEMREPPLGLEDIPHPALQIFFDEILAAPTTEATCCSASTSTLSPPSMPHWPGTCATPIRSPMPRPCAYPLRPARIDDMLEFGRAAHRMPRR